MSTLESPGDSFPRGKQEHHIVRRLDRKQHLHPV